MPCKKGKLTKGISRWRKRPWWKLPLTAARYNLAADRSSCAVVKVRHSQSSGPAMLKEATRACSSCFPLQIVAWRSLHLQATSLAASCGLAGLGADGSHDSYQDLSSRASFSSSRMPERQLPPGPNSAVDLYFHNKHWRWTRQLWASGKEHLLFMVFTERD